MANHGVNTSLGFADDVEKVFNKFDSDNDGKILMSELTDVLAALGFHPSLEEINCMMAEIDINGDAAVDLAESSTFHPESDEVAEMRAGFKAFDRDGDGKISTHDLMMSGMECTVEECERMIAAADLDGDGCIDWEEFRKMMKI